MLLYQDTKKHEVMKKTFKIAKKEMRKSFFDHLKHIESPQEADFLSLANDNNHTKRLISFALKVNESSIFIGKNEIKKVKITELTDKTLLNGGAIVFLEDNEFVFITDIRINNMKKLVAFSNNKDLEKIVNKKIINITDSNDLEFLKTIFCVDYKNSNYNLSSVAELYLYVLQFALFSRESINLSFSKKQEDNIGAIFNDLNATNAYYSSIKRYFNKLMHDYGVYKYEKLTIEDKKNIIDKVVLYATQLFFKDLLYKKNHNFRYLLTTSPKVVKLVYDIFYKKIKPQLELEILQIEADYA